MSYRPAFDIISNELRGIVRFLVNFEGFRGFTWISQLCESPKYQKPC